jgi:hypothetical protein
LQTAKAAAVKTAAVKTAAQRVKRRGESGRRFGVKEKKGKGVLKNFFDFFDLAVIYSALSFGRVMLRGFMFSSNAKTGIRRRGPAAWLALHRLWGRELSAEELYGHSSPPEKEF